MEAKRKMKKSEILDAARRGTRIWSIVVRRPDFDQNILFGWIDGSDWCQLEPRVRKGDEVAPCGNFKTNITILSKELAENKGEEVIVQIGPEAENIILEYD